MEGQEFCKSFQYLWWQACWVPGIGPIFPIFVSLQLFLRGAMRSGFVTLWWVLYYFRVDLFQV